MALPPAPVLCWDDRFSGRAPEASITNHANTPSLPQLDADLFVTDGGIETTLIFNDGLDLPDFAAFTLLDDPGGRAALDRYFDAYVAIAAEHGLGIVLETPTWRASSDWGDRLGYDRDALHRVNVESVAMLHAVRRQHQSTTTPVVVSGCLGPRGDGYRPETRMGTEEAASYHATQVRALADGGADLVTAITMTYPEEAAGIAHAARVAGMPAVLSFTVETDGRLPTGQPLAEAVEQVDEETDGYAAYFMINCAHPTHFADVLEPDAAWTRRVGGLRANASTASHAELDEAEELDAGDPADLAGRYAALRQSLPSLRVVGGCCGTDDRHVRAIVEACLR